MNENNIGVENSLDEHVKVAIALNTLSFYAGRFFSHSGFKSLVVGEWRGFNLLEIKNWFQEKLRDGVDLLNPKGFEERVINTLEQLGPEKLENIVLQDYSLTDEGIKDNLNIGTNVYRFYDLEKRYVYYAYNCLMEGELSASVTNTLCGKGENVRGNEALYSGIDVQDVLAYACEEYFSRKRMDTEFSDEQAEKIIKVGYSFGGHKALCSNFFEAIQKGEDFDIDKHECVLINALELSNKTKNFFEKQIADEDRFERITAKIINVSGNSDMIYPMNQNPFGREIFLDSEDKSGVVGHDITAFDFERQIKREDLGFKYLFFSHFHQIVKSYRELDNAYDLFYAAFMFGERVVGIKRDINGNEIKIKFSDTAIAALLVAKALILAAVYAIFHKKLDPPKEVSVTCDVKSQMTRIPKQIRNSASDYSL